MGRISESVTVSTLDECAEIYPLVNHYCLGLAMGSDLRTNRSPGWEALEAGYIVSVGGIDSLYCLFDPNGDFVEWTNTGNQARVCSKVHRMGWLDGYQTAIDKVASG